jgi:hypothetical protein
MSQSSSSSPFSSLGVVLSFLTRIGNRVLALVDWTVMSVPGVDAADTPEEAEEEGFRIKEA